MVTMDITTQGKALTSYTSNGLVTMRLLVIVNKAQFNLVYARCATHHIPTHVTQSIKLGHHNLPHLNP